MRGIKSVGDVRESGSERGVGEKSDIRVKTVMDQTSIKASTAVRLNTRHLESAVAVKLGSQI